MKERRFVAEDFSNTSRDRVPFEGDAPDELTAEQLAALNEKWLYWSRALRGSLRRYASDDEDLTQEGILALRGELLKNRQAPRHHLLKTAKVEKRPSTLGKASEAGVFRNARDERVSSEDFTRKTRHGIPFEGYPPKDLTEAELRRVNERWEQFYRTKKGDLLRFTRDEDFVSIGLLSVRRMLCLYPDCSDGLLIQQAKYDILSALKWGKSLDSRKRQAQRLDIAPTGREDFPFCTPDDTALEDEVQGEAISYNGDVRKCERQLFDTPQYQEFWNSLTERERILVKCLKEEQADEPRWYQREYVKVERRKGHARKRFLAETGVSNKQYTRTYASVRLKFYEHFGSEAEIQRERAWFSSWKPAHSLHPEKQEGYLKRR